MQGLLVLQKGKSSHTSPATLFVTLTRELSLVQTGEIILLKDFPTPPEGHPDEQMPRKYFSFSFKH